MRDDKKQLPTALKMRISDTYVLRRPMETYIDWQLSDHPSTLDMIGKWIRRVSKIAGFKTGTYA